MSQNGDTYPIDTFRKFQMAQQEAKRIDKEEHMIDQTESEDVDDSEFMNIRSNADPNAFYTIMDETPKASKRKKKKSEKKEDLFLESIKRALGENKSLSDDSYTQFSHDPSSLYTDSELINLTSSTVSSSSYSGSSCTEDNSICSVDVALMGHSSADDFQQSLRERKQSQSKDEETLDSAFISDEETFLSGYTEHTQATSSVADFQSSVVHNLSPNEKQGRSLRRHRGEKAQSVFSEPSYLEDKHDYDDDDFSCDDTYATRGTVGLVQDVFTCGTYHLCMGEDTNYLPKEDYTIGIEKTRRRRDSRATSSIPPTSRFKVKKRSSNKRLAIDAAKAAEMAKNDDVVYQEEEDANALAETLHNIFWEGDGVFIDESSNIISEKNGKINGSLDHDQDAKPKPKSNVNALPAISEASMKPYLLSAAKSFRKSISIRRQKNSVAQKLPMEIGVNEGHEIAQKSSTTQELPIEVDAEEGQTIVTILFKRQAGSTKQQFPIEFDLDEDQTIPSTPSTDLKILESESHHEETNIDTVHSTEHDLQNRQIKTAQSTSQGYEIPRKKSFRHMILLLSRSSSSKSSHKQASVAETLMTPNQSGDGNVTISVKQSSINEVSASPARTVDISISSHSTRTEPELSAIAAKKWKCAVDKTTGKTYYYNRLLKEVTWDAPPEFAEQKRPTSIWKSAYDATSGQTYYYNRQTKAVTWKKPRGFITA